MTIAAKRATATRAFYKWEDENIPNGRTLTLKEARILAAKVWLWAMGEARYQKRAVHWRIPTIVYGRGVKQNGRYLSYCEGYLKIVLAPGQRNQCVLLHELTHALGPSTHGVRFQATYLQLLMKFMF